MCTIKGALTNYDLVKKKCSNIKVLKMYVCVYPVPKTLSLAYLVQAECEPAYSDEVLRLTQWVSLNGDSWSLPIPLMLAVLVC